LVWGLFSFQTANAAIITTDVSVVDIVPGVSQFTTDGADMVGMSVTVNFLGGATETVFWTVTGAQSGAAVGTGRAADLRAQSRRANHGIAQTPRVSPPWGDAQYKRRPIIGRRFFVWIQVIRCRQTTGDEA